jgi:hypothetical protein
MEQFGPTPRWLLQNIESGESRCTKQFVHAVGSDGDVDILSQSAMKPMAPDGPSPTDRGFAADDRKQTVQRLDDSAVAAGQVLWFEHAVPPFQKCVGQSELVEDHFPNRVH